MVAVPEHAALRRIEFVEEAAARPDHGLVAIPPGLGLARRFLPFHQQCRREERGHDEGREVSLQVQQRAHVRDAVHGERAQRLAGVPIHDQPEDGQAERRGAQAERERRPDEERRAQVRERGDEVLGAVGRAEHVLGRDDEAHVEREELGPAPARHLERLARAGAVPGEDQRRGEEHPEHRRDERDRPLVAERGVQPRVAQRRVEERHGGDQRHHAHQQRRNATDGVDPHPRAGEAHEARADGEGLGAIERRRGEDRGPRVVAVHARGEARGEDDDEVAPPAPRRHHQQHAEGEPVGGPDEERQAGVERQVRGVGREQVVDGAEGDVSEGLPDRSGPGRGEDRRGLGAHCGATGAGGSAHILFGFYGFPR